MFAEYDDLEEALIELDCTVAGAEFARDAIRQGRLVDALTALERVAEPKWWNSAACQRDYDKAMGKETVE